MPRKTSKVKLIKESLILNLVEGAATQDWLKFHDAVKKLNEGYTRARIKTIVPKLSKSVMQESRMIGETITFNPVFSSDAHPADFKPVPGYDDPQGVAAKAADTSAGKESDFWDPDFAFDTTVSKPSEQGGPLDTDHLQKDNDDSTIARDSDNIGKSDADVDLAEDENTNQAGNEVTHDYHNDIQEDADTDVAGNQDSRDWASKASDQIEEDEETQQSGSQTPNEFEMDIKEAEDDDEDDESEYNIKSEDENTNQAGNQDAEDYDKKNPTKSESRKKK